MKIAGWFVNGEQITFDLDKIVEAADKDFCEKLKEIEEKRGWDTERWHVEADELIVKILKSAWYEKTAEEYDRQSNDWRYA